MADRTHRITIFKIAEKPKQERLVAAFKTLSAEHEKDGKPYILSLTVGPTLDGDLRSKGYTFVSKTEFSSLDDMRWYDNVCPAHNRVKDIVRELGLGPDEILTVYFQPTHVVVL